MAAPRATIPASPVQPKPPESEYTLLPSDPRLRGRPTWIEIDLDRLAGNVHATRSLIGDDTRLMAVVKANAYGHGADIVAQTALAVGADALAVATVDEGLALRGFGLQAPILVLGPIAHGEIRQAVVHALSLAAADVGFARAIAREAERVGVDPVSVHVKHDTGMNRFGGRAEAAHATCHFVARTPALRLAGLFTHFADADNPDGEFTEVQLASLQDLVRALAAEGIQPEQVHAANSAAIMRGRSHHLGMVRLGISLYGLPPANGYVLPRAFQPVLSVKSTVARIIDLVPGDTVSYGRTYVVTEPEQAALIPIGYADGLRREFSNSEVMAIHGQRVPIRGRVCMDQTVVGVPPGQSVAVGEVATVIGTGELGELSFERAAGTLGTLTYELVSALSPRLPRYYLRNGLPVAVTQYGVSRWL